TSVDSNQLTESAIFAVTLVLIVLDVCYAGVRSLTRRPQADNFLEYLVSRVTVIALIGIAKIVEALIPNVPLVYLTCLFYSPVSVAHIIDAARKDHVPIPPPLVGALRSLKDAVDADDEELGTHATDKAGQQSEK